MTAQPATPREVIQALSRAMYETQRDATGVPFDTAAQMVADKLAAVGMRIAGPDEAVVPREPTEAQWGGLARDIMMWLDMCENPTPRKLFDHLEAVGTEIPQWLRDEAEMTTLDRVPSKGTRVAIVYRAMLSAAEGDGR